MRTPGPQGPPGPGAVVGQPTRGVAGSLPDKTCALVDVGGANAIAAAGELISGWVFRTRSKS